MNEPAKLKTYADPSAEGCDLVRQWLREHNWAANAEFMRKLQQPEHQALPLVIVAETEAGAAGGLVAETQLAWLRISIMAVDPGIRGQGIGSSLLAEAERQALARGCRHVYVDTMSYQAPGFYLRHGYSMVGQIPDWDSQGSAKHFFTKELMPLPSA